MAAEMEVAEAAPVAAEAAERGRYAVFITPDGGWAVATAGPLCENCSGCGCGEAYRDPIPVPPYAVQFLSGGEVPARLRAILGKVMGNGRRG